MQINVMLVSFPDPFKLAAITCGEHAKIILGTCKQR